MGGAGVSVVLYHEDENIKGKTTLWVQSVSINPPTNQPTNQRHRLRGSSRLAAATAVGVHVYRSTCLLYKKQRGNKHTTRTDTIYEVPYGNIVVISYHKEHQENTCVSYHTQQ